MPIRHDPNSGRFLPATASIPLSSVKKAMKNVNALPAYVRQSSTRVLASDPTTGYGAFSRSVTNKAMGKTAASAARRKAARTTASRRG